MNGVRIEMQPGQVEWSCRVARICNTWRDTERWYQRRPDGKRTSVEWAAIVCNSVESVQFHTQKAQCESVKTDVSPDDFERQIREEKVSDEKLKERKTVVFEEEATL